MSKKLMVLGGLLTLVSTYVLTFYANGSSYIWGYPALLILPDIFMNPGSYVLSLPPAMGYVIGVLMALFLLAGVLQILGAANRGIGTLGGIFALIGALFFTMVLMIGTSVIPVEVVLYMILFSGPALVPGTIPYHFGVAATTFPGTLGLGTFVLILGGVIGMIGVAKKD